MGVGRRARQTLIAALASLLLITACSAAPGFTYIPDGAAYTDETLNAALATLDASEARGIQPDQAADVRQDRLAELRRISDDAAKLADLLTREFPAETAAVPVSVERGRYAGVDAWFVFEVWGEKDGQLVNGRVLVIDPASGDIVTSQSAALN